VKSACVAIALIVGCGGDSGSGDGSTDAASTGSSSESSTDSSSMTAPSTSPPTGSESSSGTSEGTSTSDAESSSASSTTGPEGSEGCGLPTVDPSLQWVPHTIDVGGVTRDFWVWLPEPYDPERPYPVVYQFHGCSSGDERQHNNPPVQDQSGADAIHIRGRATGDCWDTTPEGPDVLFFDALVAQIEGTLCADPARRFATGYSSGAFMTHRVGCDRGDSLRGVASIAGGIGGGECQGQVAALLIHDFNDDIVDITASEGARDTHIQRNVCSTVMPTMPVDPEPCQAYVDCAEGFPVVWCQTSGQGHSRQDQLAATAFWGFLNALPPS
jgi:polyhydroxybutyrate depolymerase